MWLFLVTPVLWVLIVWYSRAQQKSIARSVAAGHGPQMFHDYYADRFSSLQAGERITHVWQGIA